MDMQERQIMRDLACIQQRIPDTITVRDMSFLRIAQTSVMRHLLDAEQPYHRSEAYYQHIKNIIEELDSFIELRTSEGWTNESIYQYTLVSQMIRDTPQQQPQKYRYHVS